MSASEYGLHRVASAELKRLLRALHRGALASPITRSSLIEKAFGNVEAHLDLLIGRDIAAAKAVVLAVLNERGDDAPTRRGATSIVYMGPPSPGTRSRDLIEQVRALLTGALVSVHLIGLRADDRGLLRTAASLIMGRDARVRLTFEAHEDGAEAAVRELVRERFGEPPSERLEVFLCTGAVLRARVVIVDGERVLLTSGDLAASEEDGTVDVGVVVQEAALAEALEEEWSKLRDLGLVRPLRG